jgi:hypothetical protein
MDDKMHAIPAEVKSDLVTLVEAPLFSHPRFFGRWLLAAAESQEAVEIALASDANLRERLAYEPYLGLDAMLFIYYLAKSRRSFLIDIETLEGNGFLLLAEMGLFVRTGARYQMTVPNGITPKGAAAAIERLVATRDDDGVLHPEHVINCMPRFEAEQWQRRLAAMSEEARLTDRRLLLGSEHEDDVLVEFLKQRSANARDASPALDQLAVVIAR